MAGGGPGSPGVSWEQGHPPQDRQGLCGGTATPLLCPRTHPAGAARCGPAPGWRPPCPCPARPLSVVCGEHCGVCSRCCPRPTLVYPVSSRPLLSHPWRWHRSHVARRDSGHRPGWSRVLPALPASCDHLGAFGKARVSWARLRLFCPDTGTCVSQGSPPPPVAPGGPGELTALGPVGSGCAKPTPTVRLVSVSGASPTAQGSRASLPSRVCAPAARRLLPRS